LLKATGRQALGIDFSGYWYTTPEIAAVAKRRGFRACFVRSRLKPYRFHAVLFLDTAFSQSPAPKPEPVYARSMGAVDVHVPNQQST
jgi:hypothetical protein